MKYKIGDFVTVSLDVMGGESYDGLYFAPAMEKYRGMTFTVAAILDRDRYRLEHVSTPGAQEAFRRRYKQDINTWVFNDTMLIPADPVTDEPFEESETMTEFLSSL